MFWNPPFGPGRWNRGSGIRDVQPVPWPSLAPLSDGLHIEVQLHGGDAWTDITDDAMVDSTEITSDRGIRAAGPLDLVAQTGTLNFVLQNRAETVSGSRLGYYSPENINSRPGWRLGIGCRYSYWISGTPTYLFRGWIEDIDPVLERHRETVSVLATDYMNEMARHVPGIGTQVNKRADEVLRAAVLANPRQPAGMDLDTGDSTFAYALDNAQGMTALAIAQQAMQSEFGATFVKGDGTLRMRKRTARLTSVAQATFLDDMVSLRVPESRQKLINKVRATTHPRRVGATDTEVLYQLQGKPSVAAGETISLRGGFNDPANRANAVGGTDMRAPVATTDYTMNANSDGSGADLTANFTVQAIYGGSGVEYQITNNGGTLGYVTMLQARGRGLYDYDPVDAVRQDSVAIGRYGENALVMDMAYQSDANVADAVADYIVSTWALPGAVEAELGFYASKSPAYLLYALSLDVGDVINVVETASGVSRTYFINSVSLRWVMAKKLWCTWLLSRLQPADYWEVGIVGKSEVGVSTVVAPL